MRTLTPAEADYLAACAHNAACLVAANFGPIFELTDAEPQTANRLTARRLIEVRDFEASNGAWCVDTFTPLGRIALACWAAVGVGI